jgi:hypothetical protein
MRLTILTGLLLVGCGGHTIDDRDSRTNLVGGEPDSGSRAAEPDSGLPSTEDGGTGYEGAGGGFRLPASCSRPVVPANRVGSAEEALQLAIGSWIQCSGIRLAGTADAVGAEFTSDKRYYALIATAEGKVVRGVGRNYEGTFEFLESGGQMNITYGTGGMNYALFSVVMEPRRIQLADTSFVNEYVPLE